MEQFRPERDLLAFGKGAIVAQSGTGLKTVDRALEILLQFSREQPEWSASELAQALSLHRSIVYRILKTLEARGFVVQTGHLAA